MIDPIRKELLQLLGELSEEAPQVRLGQLIVNLAYMARTMEESAPYDVEDHELLEAAKEHLQTWQSRDNVAASA